MNDRYRIAVVDDTPMQCMFLKRLLDANYDVVVFPSGEDFLDAMPEYDCILLDIEMPGIDGYETCRRLRAQDDNGDTPIIFVSSHNSAEARVEAYEAGGDHFLSKPIAAGELNLKIESVITHRNALRDLKSQSSYAQQVAFSAMAGMGGLGVIIEFFRKSATVKSYQILGELVIEALNAWELRGGVQIRGVSEEVNLSTDSVISPLQSNIMATMRDMGRIFELKSRAVVNYEHVSILIYNMPIDDPDKMGRMRDNLAWLGEGADTCIANMDAMKVSKLQVNFLGQSIAQITELMQKAASSDAQNRNAVQKRTIEVLDGIEVSVGSFGLTKIQDEYVNSMVREGVDELTNAFEESALIQLDFTEILNRLQSLAKAHAASSRQ